MMFSAPVRSGWKPEPNSSSAATRPFDLDASLGGMAEAGDEAEQGALAGAVAADDGHAFAVLHLKGDVLERVERLVAWRRTRAEALFEVRAQQFGPAGVAEGFGHVLEFDQRPYQR